MSEKDPNPPARPLRHGETWTWTDYELLLQGVFNNLTVEQIAAELMRTQGAIRAQLTRLVPDDAEIANVPRARMDWLRRRLAEDPEYDWQAVLNSRANAPYRLWSEKEEQFLRDGWDRGTALPDLVLRLQVSEPAIVHRLIQLGLAADVSEIVDRLGATPGGSVEARARLLRAEVAEGIYVLVIVRAGRPITSLHHGADGAEKAFREAVGNSDNAESRPWVLRRTLDGRDAGLNWTPLISGD
jgi:hypothetical protein